MASFIKITACNLFGFTLSEPRLFFFRSVEFETEYEDFIQENENIFCKTTAILSPALCELSPWVEVISIKRQPITSSNIY